MGRKRYKDQILRQILEVCAGEVGASKTQIVYKSGMNFLTIQPYMELLNQRGLVVRIEGALPRYRITDKGEEALGHLRKLEEMVGE
ncbi:MAG: winged helix-turn-helix domain-containing protein [Methanothrix sp.]